MFWEFSTGKKHFTPGKKIRKNDFAPSEKYSSYAPVPMYLILILACELFKYNPGPKQKYLNYIALQLDTLFQVTVFYFVPFCNLLMHVSYACWPEAM